MLAPPRPPAQDDPELLIPQARARQRRRWLGAAVAGALIAGAVLGIYSVVNSTSPTRATSTNSSAAVKSEHGCDGLHVASSRVVSSSGKVIYREPFYKGAMWSELQCSGSAVWATFVNGIGTNVENDVGVRSLDRGRTWRVAFSQASRLHARYSIGNVGPWTLVGLRVAYFASSCAPCSVGRRFGTVSLSVTTDGGKTFRTRRIEALNGYAARSIRVSGGDVLVRGRRFVRKLNKPPYDVWAFKTVRLPAA